jgi:hypothetical protein
VDGSPIGSPEIYECSLRKNSHGCVAAGTAKWRPFWLASRDIHARRSGGRRVFYASAPAQRLGAFCLPRAIPRGDAYGVWRAACLAPTLRFEVRQEEKHPGER